MKPSFSRGLLMLSAMAVASTAGASGAGFYTEWTMTTTGEGRPTEMRARAWARGESYRTELLDGGGFFGRPGAYLLSHDAMQTLFLVDPEAGTYSRLSLSEMMNQLTSGMAEVQEMGEAMGRAMELSFTEPRSEVLGSEPGEPILGYPTTRHRWRYGYTMRLKVLFMDRSQRVESVTEAWATQATAPRMTATWAGTQISTGDPELDRVLYQPLEAIDGEVLKMVSDTTMTDRAATPLPAGRCSRSRCCGKNRWTHPSSCFRPTLPRCRSSSSHESRGPTARTRKRS